MNLPILPPKARAAVRAARLIALRLLALCLLWQGPVPVGHDHAGITGSLVNHLARFHALGRPAMTRCGKLCFGSCSAASARIATATSDGWHVHWILPGTDEEGLHASDRSAVLATAVDGQALVPSTEQLQVRAFQAHIVDDGVGSLAGAHQIEAASFFIAFDARRSLPESLGSMRC